MQVDPANLNNIVGVALYNSTWEFIAGKDKRNSLKMEQLALPLLMYYDDTVPPQCKSICFSLDPVSVKDFDKGQEKVFVFPDKKMGKPYIYGTKFGEVLFEADFLMKQLSMGI